MPVKPLAILGSVIMILFSKMSRYSILVSRRVVLSINNADIGMAPRGMMIEK